MSGKLAEVKLHDISLLELLIIEEKKLLSDEDAIYCLVQLSNFDFFPVPLRTKSGYIYLHDSYQNIGNLHYFPVKVKALFPKECRNLEFNLNKEKDDGELLDFFAEIIQAGFARSLLKRAKKFYSLVKILAQERRSIMKFIVGSFGLASSLAALEIGKSCRSVEYLNELLLNWHFFVDPILLLFIVLKLISILIIFFTVRYIVPLLRIKVGPAEKNFSAVLGFRLQTGRVVNGKYSFEIVNIPAWTEPPEGEIMGKMSTLGRMKLASVAITIALISLFFSVIK